MKHAVVLVFSLPFWFTPAVAQVSVPQSPTLPACGGAQLMAYYSQLISNYLKFYDTAKATDLADQLVRQRMKMCMIPPPCGGAQLMADHSKLISGLVRHEMDFEMAINEARKLLDTRVNICTYTQGTPQPTPSPPDLRPVVPAPNSSMPRVLPAPALANSSLGSSFAHL
jgi:hypothetical protein